MLQAYVGIDVACAKGKRLPICVCRWECGRLVPYPLRTLDALPPRGSGNAAALDRSIVQGFAARVAAYLKNVAQTLDLTIVRIGIDAPSAPRSAGLARRAAERALDRRRISCFKTPNHDELELIKATVRAHLENGGTENRIPHANQLWMFVGFALFDELSNLAECIEVYPQATVRALGAAAVHKSEREAAEAQLRAAARYTGWPTDWLKDPTSASIAWGPPHDRVDAYLSAWVAALEEEDRLPFGEPPHDVIWVPRLAGVAEAPLAAPARPAARAAPVSDPGAPFACPACGAKRFKRWPFGWDAHAAHACTGLSATDPAERKREFKKRFRHLFR